MGHHCIFKIFMQIELRIFLATVPLTSLHLQNSHANSISNILSSSLLDITAFGKFYVNNISHHKNVYADSI